MLIHTALASDWQGMNITLKRPLMPLCVVITVSTPCQANYRSFANREGIRNKGAEPDLKRQASSLCGDGGMCIMRVTSI